MTRIPPPWMIDEQDRQRRAHEEPQRPHLDAPPPQPPPDPSTRDVQTPSRVVIIDLWPSDEA